MTDTLVPISRPATGVDVELNVLDVLRSGRLAQGPMVERFEHQVAAMAGTRHAVAMSNGTVTLEASLRALGIGPGDEVITTAFTFVATVNAALSVGATVRFADIRSDFTIDPDSVAELVNRRTAAIVPVHLYGLPADMFAIQAIAARYGLAIVEDAAQAHGAEIRDRRVGSFGVGSFSFYATKNVSCGEGGAVTTDDDQLARRLRLLRNQGMVDRYVYEQVGSNLRMTELQAAVGLPGMDRLGEIIRVRRANAAYLSEELMSQDRLALPTEPFERRHVWHQYTVLAKSPSECEALETHLQERTIASGRYYPKVIYDYEAFGSHDRVVVDRCRRAEDFAGRCLSVPVHDQLTSSELHRVAGALSSFGARAAVDRT